MDKDAFKTRVTNSQLAGLHVAAAVFLIIGVGAEIAVGNPVSAEGDLNENFDSPLLDPAWIAMEEVATGGVADCFSSTQVNQESGELRITALRIAVCGDGTNGQMIPLDLAAESEGDVTSGFVQAGFRLPLYGQLRAEFTPPPQQEAEAFVALTHPSGADTGRISLFGDQVTVQLDGAVRAQATIPVAADGVSRVFKARIAETADGVSFEVSVDNTIVLDHTESVALNWRVGQDTNHVWTLQLALGADPIADLPQTLAIDSISYDSIDD